VMIIDKELFCLDEDWHYCSTWQWQKAKKMASGSLAPI